MVDVQQIFDMAMDLMDEADETTGSTDTMDTKEYRIRTISILNSGIQVIYPYSSNFKRTATGRPAADQLYADNRGEPDFSQLIPIDDALSLSLLPFYLASLLRAGEDSEFSARMMNEFNRAFYDIRANLPGTFEQIIPAYGL